MTSQDLIAVVGLAIPIATGLFVWLLRLDRNTAKTLHAINWQFSEEHNGSIASRVKHHSDELKAIKSRLDVHGDALDIIEVMRYDEDTIAQLASLLNAAKIMVKRKREKGESNG